MNIYQLIYVSTPSCDLKIEEIKQIVAAARIENESKSISGFLCASDKFFIQCLEGDQPSVDSLAEKIFSDSRHSDVKVLGSEHVAERTFGHWGMGVALKMERQLSIINRYAQNQDFNPYRLSYEDALNMLLDFSMLKE